MAQGEAPLSISFLFGGRSCYSSRDIILESHESRGHKSAFLMSKDNDDVLHFCAAIKF